MQDRSINGYEICIGDDDPILPLAQLAKTYGFLRPGTFEAYYQPANPAEEEAGISVQDIETASLIFERTRAQVRGALRAIVEFVFRELKLPTRNGFDIGSGATGAMVECLLPSFCVQSSWLQMDINSKAVLENRRRHPSSVIVEGSYLDIGHAIGTKYFFDIVTGLSSLDSTAFVGVAIEQIRNTLQRGGYLFHMQDVRPGIGFGQREMQYMGYNPPYAVDFAESEQGPAPIVFRSPAGSFSAGELFRRNFVRAIQNTPGMELVLNQWITASKPLRSSPGRQYALNMLLTRSDIAVEEASAVVTVARRV